MMKLEAMRLDKTRRGVFRGPQQRARLDEPYIVVSHCSPRWIEMHTRRTEKARLFLKKSICFASEIARKLALDRPRARAKLLLD